MVVVALGTSLTANGGWLAPLAAELGTQAVNLAQAGATSRDGLTQLDALPAVFDIALVEFAVNDAALHRGVSLIDSTANLRRIVDAFRLSPTTRVWLMLMSPVFGWRGWVRPRLQQYEAAHQAVARQATIGIIDHRPAWAAFDRPALARAIPDGLHPLPEAARAIIVPAVIQAIATAPTR